MYTRSRLAIGGIAQINAITRVLECVTPNEAGQINFRVSARVNRERDNRDGPSCRSAGIKYQRFAKANFQFTNRLRIFIRACRIFIARIQVPPVEFRSAVIRLVPTACARARVYSRHPRREFEGDTGERIHSRVTSGDIGVPAAYHLAADKDST